MTRGDRALIGEVRDALEERRPPAGELWTALLAGALGVAGSFAYGGDCWVEARLSEPLPDRDVWRQWAFEWAADADAYEVVVRAVDGEGRVQAHEETSAFPSGATGWVSRTVRP